MFHVKFCLLTVGNLRVSKLCVYGARGGLKDGHLIKLPFKEYTMHC